MERMTIMTSALALGLTTTPLSARTTETQQSQSRQQERVGAILGSLFDDRLGTTSLEAQWMAGRTPLATQHTQFETRVDTEVRSGAVTQATATRLIRTMYSSLVMSDRHN